MHETDIIIIHTIITNKLDYCNLLFYDLPDFQIPLLQKVPNIAASVVTKSKRDSPILKYLYWLPVLFCIRFTIIVLICQVYHEETLDYLNEHITNHHVARALRSDDIMLLFLKIIYLNWLF